jgi:hypothetical protein
MPIEVTADIREVVERSVTKTLSAQVLQFTIRANGPDAGEIYGTTQTFDGETVAAQWDWVVPARQVMPVAMAKVGNKTLYQALYEALYSFEQVRTPPN